MHTEANIEQITQLLFTHGLGVVITLISVYVVYRYVIARIELMKREFDEKLKDKKYRLQGQMTRQGTPDQEEFLIDVQVEELKT